MYEIFESLTSYCIIDNLGNQYNSYKYRPAYSDYVTIALSDRIKSEIIYIGGDWRTSLPRLSGARYSYNSACFVFIDKEIYLPYSYIAPKVTKKATKKKPAEVIFTPQYIGQVVGEITIPVDVLTKVTNFELKQIE